MIAVEKFAKIYKVVEPKILKQKAAENELNEVMAILRMKQQELAEVEAKIQALKDHIDEKNREFQLVQDKVDLTAGRINRAGRLTSALADEEVRWKETVENLTKQLWAVPGDVLVASACVAYLGAFSTDYRNELTTVWVAKCQEHQIPSSSEFILINILGDPYEMRTWEMAGLPRDAISIENGLYATRALRWPLMIDPQEQANRWIRNLEKANNLQIIKMNDPHLNRCVENCVRQGLPMLIEDIDEKINPSLKPVLQRETYVFEGKVLLKLGDVIIDYDNNFRFYMTTKLSNPHYLPEICINVTLVNFLVTERGLEDQLLGSIVAIELPALETQRQDLVVKINSDKQQLLALEDKVLKLLFHSQGNILDDEELVETLNDSKETSLIIATRLIDTEETEKVITATREKYRDLAYCGAILYFVVAGLAEIDPMYQFSLKYFTQVFCNVMLLEHPKMEIAERIAQLKQDELKSIFSNISRGLFEAHKIIFSFILTIAMEKMEGRVSDAEFSFLVKGAVGSIEAKPKPKTYKMSSLEWENCCFLEKNFPGFTGLCDDLKGQIQIKLGEFEETIEVAGKVRAANNWSKKLTNFEKLLLIRTLKKEKLTIAITSYVETTLGSFFTLSTGANSQLKVVFQDMSNITPLVFVLSTGSDPMSNFLKFAEEVKYLDKFYSISLGQGQGPIAEALLQKSIKLGHWVFLQNCHLATSWMGTLEIFVRNISLGVITVHNDFRLFMSSMPTKTFPVNVLQNSVKVTNEPPKGIKSNLLRALGDLTKDYFEHHVLGNKWRAIVFGLCMFHSVILERKKFGPLGWNILYEFNESDRGCGLRVLDMFISRATAEEIPWDAIFYINSEITWGGRVTDFWDLRCLKTILKIFEAAPILQEGYKYSSNPRYFDPVKKTIRQYIEYIQTFPIEDDPEIFGMNRNANIVFLTKETNFLTNTLLLVQPKTGGGGGDDASMSPENIAMEACLKIESSLATEIQRDDVFPSLLIPDPQGNMPSLTICLVQEIDRYNNLLKIVHGSLRDLKKAIKGLVVMSDILEGVYKALLNNQVSALWSKKSFLSIKPLPNWVCDFQRRIDFIKVKVFVSSSHS